MDVRKEAMSQNIKQVVGPEPKREGEYPDQLWIGYGIPPVARIEYEEQNLGTYGIGWFVAYSEDGAIIRKMNAAHVAVVNYE